MTKKIVRPSVIFQMSLEFLHSHIGLARPMVTLGVMISNMVVSDAFQSAVAKLMQINQDLPLMGCPRISTSLRPTCDVMLRGETGSRRDNAG